MTNSSLQVIGAGLPRTGTSSLRAMLEQLLDAPCYHMRALYERPDIDGPLWMSALQGDMEALDTVVADSAAAVDWPASVLWRELAERHPDALVILSHRGSADTWWTSADATVWEVMREVQGGRKAEHVEGIHALMRELAGFSEDLDDATAAHEAYDRHYAEAVATIPADRLLIWQPGDGWAPLCERLGLPIPDEEPAHANARTDFRSRHEAGK